MRRLRDLQMMAGLRTTRAERVTRRQIQKFRRQMAENEQRMLLVDKVRERELGAEGTKAMPLARKP